MLKDKKNIINLGVDMLPITASIIEITEEGADRTEDHEIDVKKLFGPTVISGEIIAGKIRSGKTKFDNTEIGYILGVDDSDNVAKLFIGDTDAYLNWDGSSFTIAGGNITGGTIQTHEADNTGVKIISDIGMRVYGGALYFSTDDGTFVGALGTVSSYLWLTFPTANSLYIQGGIRPMGDITPYVSNLDLGSSSKQWEDIWIDGKVETDEINLHKAPSVSVATPSTHKVAIECNGSTYYLLLSNV